MIKGESNEATSSPINGVAILYNGRVYSLPKPNRHHDVIRLIGGISGKDVQGFIDEEGTFLDRKEALVRAKATGQIINSATIIGDRLYSEDLW